MAQIPIMMPQLGESIAEATIIKLLVQPGQEVQEHQEIMEVETSKATTTVTSPCKGTVSRISAVVNEAYPVGAELGFIEVYGAIEAGLAAIEAPIPQPAPLGAPAPEVVKQRVEPTVRGLPVPVNSAGASYMSPRMKARMHELGLHASDLAGIAG